jgi:hypothetical protein
MTMPERTPGADGSPPIVDWGRTARRLRAIVVMILALVVLAWFVTGLLDGGFRVRLLAELVGFGLLAAFAAEVVVVGGSAVSGLLAAGARGERLASADVTLLPPQLQRRRRR